MIGIVTTKKTSTKIRT